jgi:hypothetical protein
VPYISAIALAVPNTISKLLSIVNIRKDIAIDVKVKRSDMLTLPLFASMLILWSLSVHEAKNMRIINETTSKIILAERKAITSSGDLSVSSSILYYFLLQIILYNDYFE